MAAERDHYASLGIGRDASDLDVRAAYRRLVLKYHPDRNRGSDSLEKFHEIRIAYEVLNDPERRQDYDRFLRTREEPQPKKQTTRTATSGQSAKQTSQKSSQSAYATVASDVAKLAMLFNRGRLAEAEALADSIVRVDTRQHLPYAVLADCARARGNLKEAAKLYAYALQMDPKNVVYLRKHEELLQLLRLQDAVVSDAYQQPVSAGSALAAIAMAIVCCTYVALSKEPSSFKNVPGISSWTLGLFTMLLLTGISLGASLSIGGYFDRFTTPTATGRRLHPAVVLGGVAMVSFWVAVFLYIQLALIRKTWNFTTTRLLSAVAACVFLFALAGEASRSIDALEVVLWGGNVLTCGAICGWGVADGFTERDNVNLP